MAFWDNVEKVLGAGQKTVNFIASLDTAATRGDPEIEGRKLNEWERRWQPVGRLQASDDPTEKSELWRERNAEIGVYRILLGRKVMYIGKAEEVKNGGFRKRLSDYTRKSDSGRKHASGQKIHANAQMLYVEIVSTATVAGAKRLEAILIAKYRPGWNVMGVG